MKNSFNACINVASLLHKSVGDYISGSLIFDLRQYTDICFLSSISLQYKVIKNKDFHLVYLYNISTNVQSVCIKCLSDININVFIHEVNAMFGIGNNNYEFSVYNNMIYLDDLIYQELLLYGIDNFVCSSNCKGICSKCYKNLNYEKCDCER